MALVGMLLAAASCAKEDVDSTGLSQAVQLGDTRFREGSAAGELIFVPGLDQPLVAAFATSLAEDTALQVAIESFRSFSGRPKVDRTEFLAPFEAFATSFPRSGWTSSVLTSLGIAYNRAGFFSRAQQTLKSAWDAGRASNDPRAATIVDRALGELLRSFSRVGKADAVERLLADVKDRQLSPSSREYAVQAQEGALLMRLQPGNSFLCGPKALKNVLHSLRVDPSTTRELDQIKSGPQGFSLDELSKVADKYLPHRVVVRRPGQRIPVPSVVHWKVDHYAAIVAVEEGLYRVQDPTAAVGDLMLSEAAINEESSGHFLVPDSVESDPLWTGADHGSLTEVRGMGNVGPMPGAGGRPDDHKPGDGDPDPNNWPPPPRTPPTPTPRGCQGMCVPSAYTQTISLNLNDTPVGYAPRIGPAVYMSLSFNQREAQPLAYSPFFNVGPYWTMGVLSYVQEDMAAPGSSVVRQVSNGGQYSYSGYSAVSGGFDFETLTGSLLGRKWNASDTSKTTTSYELLQVDGSRLVYAQSDGATTGTKRWLLSQYTDPQGYSIVWNYDSTLRVTSIKDAVNRLTTFGYTNANPRLVTSITDPFGRSATLDYDAQGRLVKITDPATISSSFGYDDTDSGKLKTLTTPYGTTNFNWGEGPAPGPGNPPSYSTAYKRWLTITDPDGNTERYEYRFDEERAAGDINDPRPDYQASGWTDSEDTSYHPGMCGTASRSMKTIHGKTDMVGPYTSGHDKDYLRYRNSFYWNAKAYAAAQADPTHDLNYATTYHWAHTPNGTYMAELLESVKPALERRIWYNYPNQTNPIFQAANNQPSGGQPSAIGRCTGDGKLSLTTTTYDASGNVTSVTDPIGRVVNTGWATGQDLVFANRKVSSSTVVTLQQYTGYSLHRPSQMLDEAGKTTSFSWTSYGAIDTVTDPVGNSMKYYYDSFGRLTSRANPAVGTLSSHTYLANCETSNPNHVNCDLPSTTTDSEGKTLAYTYDALDRIVDTAYPDGTHERRTYTNHNGTGLGLSLRTKTDRLGSVTTYTYDRERRELSETDPVKTVSFTYHPNGAVKSMADGKSQTTTWDVDVQGRVTTKTFADSKTFQYLYDASGRLAVVTDPANQIKYYVYNADDSVMSISYSGAINSTPSTSFVYDPYYPRIANFFDGPNGTYYTYYTSGTQGGGKLQNTTSYFPSFGSYTVNRQYDNAGRPYATTVGSSSVEVWTYDALDRVQSHQTTGLGTFTYSYLGKSSAVSSIVSSLSGIRADFGYDTNTNDRRLLSITNSNGARSYSYPSNDAYRIGEVIVSKSGAQLSDTLYSYYRDYKLGGVTPRVGNTSSLYKYDLAGNIIALAGGAAQTFNSVNALLTSAGAGPYSFTNDARGQRTSGGPFATFTWDARGYLAGVSSPSAGSATYTYNVTGRRTSVTQSGSTKRFIWCGEIVCGVVNSAGQLLRIYDEGEYDVASGKKLVYMRDHLGSVRDVVNAATGTVDNSYDYSEFGQQLNGTTGTQSFYKFARMFQDTAIPLLSTRTRTYDGQTGRFLSRDPMGEAGGINLYAYASNNPTNRLDPMGLTDWMWPANGRVNNNSPETVWGYDWTTDSFTPVAPHTKSSISDDLDFIYVDGRWHKITPANNFDIDEEGHSSEWWGDEPSDDDVDWLNKWPDRHSDRPNWWDPDPSRGSPDWWNPNVCPT